MTSETYKTQNRGGVGIKGMTTNENDFVEKLISMTTHDYLMFFTNKGKVYRVKGYEIPQYSRQSKGIPIVNLLPFDKDEEVTAMLKINQEEKNNNIVFCTQNGLIKRTALSEFENIRKSGKIAIFLKENDQLISVKKTTGENEIVIASSNGRMIRFNEQEIRIMGRTASGVKGIDLGDGKCVGCEIANNDEQILVVTEKGYGKRTNISEYRMTHRGSKGVKALNITDKNGNIVSFKIVHGDEDLMIITNSGIIIRLSVEQISNTGRVAQGVRLIHLKDDQYVTTISLVEKEELDALAEKIVFTGPIDQFYHYQFGELEYRSLRFETEILEEENYQGNAVVNYTDYEVPYTRVIEHKHFEFLQGGKTVITREYPDTWTKEKEPYYPVNDEKNNQLYQTYRNRAKQDQNVIFGGRLGQYQYYDMDKVILEALNCVKENLN